eukprot:2996677-Amphidinium_carterae.2
MRGVFHLSVNRFAALDRELNNDEAGVFSAQSDEEQASTAASEEATCSMGVGCEQLSSKGCDQLVTCSEGGGFAVRHALQRIHVAELDDFERRGLD